MLVLGNEIYTLDRATNSMIKIFFFAQIQNSEDKPFVTKLNYKTVSVRNKQPYHIQYNKNQVPFFKPYYMIVDIPSISVNSLTIIPFYDDNDPTNVTLKEINFDDEKTEMNLGEFVKLIKDMRFYYSYPVYSKKLNVIMPLFLLYGLVNRKTFDITLLKHTAIPIIYEGEMDIDYNDVDISSLLTYLTNFLKISLL